MRRQSTKLSCQTTTATKNDHDGRTMPISTCTRGTLALVPHSHIDFLFLQKMQKKVNVRMWSRNKDGNDRMRRMATHLSCQTTTAMNNDHDGRCQSAFDTSNSHLVPHSQHSFFQKNAKVNVRMWSRSKDGNDGIRRQATKLSCQTTTAMNNYHDGRCQSAFVHVELAF